MSRPRSDRASDETLPAGLAESGDEPIVRVGLQRGDVVGRYVVLGRVGAGGMGVVYAAYDPGLDRKVALKVLHPELRVEGRPLLQEAQAMARLAHPNVVAVHDVGEHEGAVFLAMEYVEGTTLRRFLSKRPRSWRTVVRAFVMAGRGLAAAHAKGLVHRDFKPDNAMVDDEGAEADDGPMRVRVLDFGLARGAAPTRLADAGSRDTTRAGTPAYMAPEQFDGAPAGPAVDQFSFCVALFEGLHGERPFEGGSLAELSISVRAGRMRATPASEVPAWVRGVIARGLAVDPDARWPSMHALLRALERDPTRRRRVVIGVLAAVGIAGTVAAAIEVDERRRLAACEAEGESIRDAWNPTLADAVGVAFAGRGLPYANDSWSRARPRFDAFADAWARTRADVCRRATVDRTLGGRTLELARDCLAENRGRLEAMAAQLREASPGAVERSVEWGLALPDPQACTDETELQRRLPPSADPAVRDAVVAMHREVVTIAALVESGDIDGAKALADDMLARAEALDWPPALAVAKLAWGNAASGAGEFEAAAAALEEAFELAGRAGQDLTAAEAAGDLAFVVGHELARTAEGRAWGEVARVFVDRVGVPEHDPTARSVANAIGAVRIDEGEMDEAVAVYGRLVAIAREHLGADHPSLAMALQNLGVAESHRGRNDEALRLFEDALAIRESALGATHPSVATSLLNVSAAQALLGHRDEAVATAKRALDLRLAIYGAGHPKVVSSQASLANAMAEVGRHADAVELGEEVLAQQRRARGERHPNVAGTLQTLAFSYVRLGRVDEGLAALRTAIDILRESRGAEHRHTALAVHALAEAYAFVGRREEARAGYRDALVLFEALSGAERQTAALLASLGALDLDAGEVETGRERCERALTMLAGRDRVRELAAARLCAAGASWRRAGEHARAIDLVRQAREQLAGEASERAIVDELDAWLERAAADDGVEPPPSLPPAGADRGPPPK